MKLRRLIAKLPVGAEAYQRATFCVTAKSVADVADGSKMRRTRIEHMLSAYHAIATHERRAWIGRFVPIGDMVPAAQSK